MNLAEKAYMGTILKENFLINETVIKPEHLTDSRHQKLFEEIKRLTTEGKKADLVTLAMSKNIQDFGGMSYINELLSYADPVKFDSYENLVLETWREQEKDRVLTTAKMQEWPIEKVIGELERINTIRKTDDHKEIKNLLLEVYETPWQETYEQRGATTGIKLLNDAINGLQDSEFIIIAARPSMGKTDFMLHLVKNVGWQGYIPIVFSLEMPAEKLRDRMIASTGRYNRNKMRNPYRYLTPKQKETWTQTLTMVNKTNVHIFDQSGQSIPEMRAKIRKIINQEPNKKPVIFIDYLTLIKPQKFYNGNAHLQVTEISRDLKNLAKDFNCPVVCLAQLNRGVENRSDKRPLMSDIRESGSVEQDADVIMFLYREKYYDKESNDDTLEIIVAKARNGTTLTVNVRYNEATGEIIDES